MVWGTNFKRDIVALALAPALSQNGRGSKRLRLLLRLPFSLLGRAGRAPDVASGETLAALEGAGG
jgi:hypothetical protein